MAIVAELLRVEEDGTLSFGNHELEEKAKLEDFQHDGDLYKIKTSRTMTKLEKNGLFLYESVPGTSVMNFKETEEGLICKICGNEDAQLILGLEENTSYEIMIEDASYGRVDTKIGGKLNVAMNLAGRGIVQLEVRK